MKEKAITIEATVVHRRLTSTCMRARRSKSFLFMGQQQAKAQPAEGWDCRRGMAHRQVATTFIQV